MRCIKTYKGDTHVHTEFSFDSKQKLESAALTAKKKNLDFIAFTDHVEFSNQPVKEVVHRINHRNGCIDDLRRKSNIKIIKGIEVSEPHLYESELRYFKEVCDIDYILGSIHHIYGIPLKKMANQKDAYNLYLRSMLKMVEKADIDTLAHLDYIKRYIDYFEYDPELLKEVLSTIIARNISLEVNTSGIRRCDQTFPSEEILNLYYELGGRNITFGSDAHTESEIYDSISGVSEDIKINFNPGYVLQRKFRNIK